MKQVHFFLQIRGLHKLIIHQILKAFDIKFHIKSLLHRHATTLRAFKIEIQEVHLAARWDVPQ